MCEPDIDGFLVGEASLKTDFATIVAAANFPYDNEAF